MTQPNPPLSVSAQITTLSPRTKHTQNEHININLFEGIIFDRLVIFLNTHDVIAQSQHRFRKTNLRKQMFVNIKQKILKNTE